MIGITISNLSNFIQNFIAKKYGCSNIFFLKIFCNGLFQTGKTTSIMRTAGYETSVSRHNEGSIRDPLKPLKHRGTRVSRSIKRALNWVPITARSESLSEIRCNFFQSVLKRICSREISINYYCQKLIILAIECIVISPGNGNRFN